MYLEPGQPIAGGASSSRSPSPSPSASPSPAPSLVITPTPSAQNHIQNHISQPIPTRPAQPQTNNVNHMERIHHPGSQGSVQSLAPPPPAPHGPRLPHRSNTPSPERGSFHHLPRTSIESAQDVAPPPRPGSKLAQHSSEEWSDLEDEECKTPVRPSAKALGKRRVVEPPEGERKLEMILCTCG